ncbi:hypothetical protein G5I_01138 [Acromyrmex echinatior]|uniref:Uncharacterized protein n=1 Tax=Acromyrmex echinatior TaxID=103372 RepID=F4W6T3_ACREC|nr:hypothetical protein G5I_01138 [Acromyrmex echinatior]
MSQRRQREQGTRLEIYPKILAGSNQVDLISLSGPNKHHIPKGPGPYNIQPYKGHPYSNLTKIFFLYQENVIEEVHRRGGMLQKKLRWNPSGAPKHQREKTLPMKIEKQTVCPFDEVDRGFFVVWTPWITGNPAISCSLLKRKIQRFLVQGFKKEAKVNNHFLINTINEQFSSRLQRAQEKYGFNTSQQQTPSNNFAEVKRNVSAYSLCEQYILDYPSREICTAPTITDARLSYVWVDASRLSIGRKIGNESEQVGLSLTVTIPRYVQPWNKGKPNYGSSDPFSDDRNGR